MEEQSLEHARWNCKYHIVFAPKYRRQIIYGRLKNEIGKRLPHLLKSKNMPDILLWQISERDRFDFTKIV